MDYSFQPSPSSSLCDWLGVPRLASNEKFKTFNKNYSYIDLDTIGVGKRCSRGNTRMNSRFEYCKVKNSNNNEENCKKKLAKNENDMSDDFFYTESFINKRDHSCFKGITLFFIKK